MRCCRRDGRCRWMGVVVASRALCSEELELGVGVDAALQASWHGAASSVEGVHSPSLEAANRGHPEPVAHANALDDEHGVLGPDLADPFYLAGDRGSESATSGRHHIVEEWSRAAGSAGLDAVKLGHFGVHAEDDRFLLAGIPVFALRRAARF